MITRMSPKSKTSIQKNQARIQALSHARLSSYRQFFGAKTDEEALGLYQWNEELSAALFRTISLVEIVLRNQFHSAMSRRYGVAGAVGSRDWYGHVELNRLSAKKICEITHTKHHSQWLPKVPTPSPDDVVSRLTFGFWPHMLDLTHDAVGQLIDWGSIILDILPGHRQRLQTHWAKRKHRDTLFARLDLCNELRNWIAHHEPVWKLGPLMPESRPRQGAPLPMVAPAPVTPAEALTRLQLLYTRVTELLAWLSPEISSEHAVSDTHLRCQSLLTLPVLDAYRRTLPPLVLDLAYLHGARALRKALRYASRHQQPVLLKDGHRTIGHLTCVIA